MFSSETIAAYLSSLRESTGWSVQKWSDASGVPVSTINRLLTAHNASPQFCTVAALFKAAGGSLDDLVGIDHPAPPPSDSVPPHAQDLLRQNADLVSAMSEHVRQLQFSIAENKRTIAKLRKGIAIRNAVLGALLFLFGALLMWDLTDPRYGFLYRTLGISHDAQLLPHQLKG